MCVKSKSEVGGGRDSVFPRNSLALSCTEYRRIKSRGARAAWVTRCVIMVDFEGPPEMMLASHADQGILISISLADLD